MFVLEHPIWNYTLDLKTLYKLYTCMLTQYKLHIFIDTPYTYILD